MLRKRVKARLFQQRQGTIVTGFDSCCSLAVVDETDFTEVISIVKLLFLLRFLVVSCRCRRLVNIGLNRDFKLTVSNEVHETIVVFLVILLILILTDIWINVGLVIEFHENVVWDREFVREF